MLYYAVTMSGGHHAESEPANWDAVVPASGFLGMIILLPILAVPFVGELVMQQYHGGGGGGGGGHH